MLRVVYRLAELDFGRLMAVYAQSNRDNAKELYGHLEENLALLEVEGAFYQYLREDFFRVKGAFYAVWEENGEYISVLRLEPYKDGLLLEALETHPAYRRKGFAGKLMRAVLEMLKVQGWHAVYSHINKRNTASLQTHICCGFRRISEQAVYIDGSVTQRACTMKFEL